MREMNCAFVGKKYHSNMNADEKMDKITSLSFNKGKHKKELKGFKDMHQILMIILTW